MSLLANATSLALGTLDDSHTERAVRALLERAGVHVGGGAPHDIELRDRRLYARILRDGSLGLGEAYMDGWWDAPRLDETLHRILSARLDLAVRSSWTTMALALQARLTNLQALRRAFEVGERHYDIGNDLYAAMLDERLIYTCAYWQNAGTLEEAQEHKLNLVCRKVGLRPGMTVLELGCGWGGFARFAAERYGVSVTGYTVSKEQAGLATERCRGLPVQIRLADYRQAKGHYDAVISIGIMEHVGPRNYRTYMKVADRCLRPNGVAFVHTIAGNRATAHVEPWFHKYIFPNANLPTMAQLGMAMDELFVLEDLHNIGPHYDRTLMEWFRRFDAAWPRLRQRYGERFYRMWKYYLLSAAAGFRARYNQLFQVVMTRPGTPQPSCRLS